MNNIETHTQSECFGVDNVSGCSDGSVGVCGCGGNVRTAVVSAAVKLHFFSSKLCADRINMCD